MIFATFKLILLLSMTAFFHSSMGGTAFEVAAGVQTRGLIQSLMSAATVRLLSVELKSANGHI